MLKGGNTLQQTTTTVECMAFLCSLTNRIEIGCKGTVRAAWRKLAQDEIVMEEENEFCRH